MSRSSFVNKTLQISALSHHERRFHPVLDISVIIPTYNRWESLSSVYDSLASQRNVDLNKVEIIIIDDGSSDGTRRIIEQIAERGKIATQYLFQKNKGPAAARNTGVLNAEGEIVLFLGDDTLASSDLLRQHIDFHKVRYPEPHTAILGFCPMVKTTCIDSTLIQSWLNRKQMAFQNLSHMETTSHHYFYTCNVSLKRDFLVKVGLFDERFPFAAGEDIELGSRLADAGMSLYYSQSALAYHIHPISLCDYIKRFYKQGRSVAIKNQITGKSGSDLIGSRDKISPLLEKNPAKFIIFLILNMTSILAVISGFIFEKFRYSFLFRKKY